MATYRVPVNERDPAWPGRLALVLVALFAIAGCAQESGPPLEPRTTESAAWFAAARGEPVGDSYSPYYEQTAAQADRATQAEALNRWGAEAEAGNPRAAYELGKAYRYGNGLAADKPRAADWLRTALSQPHDHWPHAAYQLGTMYMAGEGVAQDFDMARRLLLAAVDRGYARAGLPLARTFAQGRGVETDLPRAEKLALHSAQSGDVESHLWLLRAYRPGGLFGDNPRQSSVLGERLSDLLAARADAGDVRAMRDLAVIRYQGLGVARDREAALRLLERAAQLQHPESLAAFGEDLAKGRNGFAADPREGFRIMRQAANRYWYPDAMAMVAEAYERGLGTERDPVAAENWYRRAVEAGSPRAAARYGRMLTAREGDEAAQRRGVTLLRRAAAALSPAAWAALGAAHLEGRGVERDPEQAVALLTRAADAGEVDAMLTLGKGYHAGEGLPQDPDRAKQWLQRADAAGSREARLLLGRGMLTGTLPGDPLEGISIVASFAQSGDPEAMMTLARAMRDGETVPRDTEAARNWFRNAMEAGHPAARTDLAALLYQQGKRQQDLAQLEEAADLGHAGAMTSVGRAYLLGEGAPHRPVRGALLLERAVAAGSTAAAQTLGAAYLRGEHGLTRDPAQAVRLLEIAAAAGDTAAERDLGYALINPDSSGLRPNPQRGLKLLTAAAEKGDGRAMQLLGRVYLEGGKGVDPQPEDAEVWLTRAAEKGFGTVPTTPQAAALDTAPEEPSAPQDVASLQEAAEAGDEAARLRLATLYLFGSEEVPAQPQTGEAMLQPAVRDGDADAMLALGLAYLHGSFGERRIDEGARLLFEAARADHPAARNVLTETVLHARGMDETERAEAESWLDATLAGDPESGLRTVTAMLREGLVNAPLAAAQAVEQGSAER